MHNLAKIESYYKKFIKDMPNWLPEDIITVDLNLLQRLDLLDYNDPKSEDPSLTRYFHVIESEDKITLINEQFVVWIVPEKIEEITITYTLVAVNKGTKPNLQLAFVNSGVYNTSKLVLRVLEKLLEEIQENEEMIKNLENG
jgi:hypothetical protein